jgi:zona occludens toxin
MFRCQGRVREMLFLITGQPGNGKTLYALNHVEKRRVDEGRAVYYHGVKGLTLPWLPLPMAESPFTSKQRAEGFPALVPDWDVVPDGSMVFVDECHKIFPPRGGSKVAHPYVALLAEHRHRGFDVFIITQGHNDIDVFLRSRIGKHFHVDRRFGVEATRLWQFERWANPTSAKDRKEGQSSRWVFPKESYAWYTSSVEHTHKKDLPWKKILLVVGMSFVLVACVGLFLHRFFGQGKASVAKSSGGEGSVVNVNGSRSVLDSGANYWGRGRVARIYSVPQSAPIYDELQKVRSQPRIDGCLQIVRGASVECRCFGPNGAVIDVAVSDCVVYMKRGWFDETRQYVDAKVSNIAHLNSASGVGSGVAEAVGVK